IYQLAVGPPVGRAAAPAVVRRAAFGRAGGQALSRRTLAFHPLALRGFGDLPEHRRGRVRSVAGRGVSRRQGRFGNLRGRIAARGVRCSAGQVIVTAGSQQALDLAARLLLDPGDVAWVEDPGYIGARGALFAAGVRPVPVPVDSEGLSVASGERRAPGARLAYV